MHVHSFEADLQCIIHTCTVTSMQLHKPHYTGLSPEVDSNPDLGRCIIQIAIWIVCIYTELNPDLTLDSKVVINKVFDNRPLPSCSHRADTVNKAHMIYNPTHSNLENIHYNNKVTFVNYGGMMEVLQNLPAGLYVL